MPSRLSRRRFISAVGTGLAAAPFALRDGAAFENQLPPERPKNLRVAAKPVLTPADFEYLGAFRTPANTEVVNFGFADGTMTGRLVGGDTRLFFTGRNDSPLVYECRVPSSLQRTGAITSSTPQAALVRVWGDVTQGKAVTVNNTERWIHGLLWHGDRLWWAYGDSYNVAGHHDPSIGYSALNQSTGAVTAYGPWRTQRHSQRTRGILVRIPDAFATLHTGGKVVAVGGEYSSGGANCNFGPTLFAIPDIASTTPPDALGSSAWTLSCQALIAHDITHRQSRTPDYIECAWKVLYDCAQGSSLTPGTTILNTHGTDCPVATAWVDLPDKQGVISAASWVKSAPGQPTPHVWYAPYDMACCHGQTDIRGGDGTGPHAYWRTPVWNIYDAADLATVAAGEAREWSVAAKHTVYLDPAFGAPCAPSIPGWQRVAWNHFGVGGMWFDAASRRLYASEPYGDAATDYYSPRPLVHVWAIR